MMLKISHRISKVRKLIFTSLLLTDVGYRLVASSV